MGNTKAKSKAPVHRPRVHEMTHLGLDLEKGVREFQVFHAKKKEKEKEK